MEIEKIEKNRPVLVEDEVRTREPGGRTCTYYKDKSCLAPKLRFRLCQSCSRCAPFVQKAAVRSVFGHVKAFAISLLKRLDIQLSK